MRRTAFVGIFLTIAILWTPVSAAQNSTTYDIQTLTTLFDAYLKKNSDDSYLEKRIADERARLRAQADKEIQALAEPIEKDPLGTDTVALPKALDRQRNTVNILQEYLRDRSVDLDLLKSEEKKYYLSPESGTGSNDGIRLTKSHAELLAKKTVLQERIDAVQANLSLQNDRLAKLTRQGWYDQFESLFGLMGYVLIILGAAFLNNFVLRRIVKRVDTNGKRYLISKFATTGIYAIATLWILSKLLSDYPGALASVAIVGAGIAVALQDVVKDLMGWIIILQRRLYTLGDRVTIGAFTGDVIDIGPLRTSMLEVSNYQLFHAHERTSKTLYIPNSLVLKEPVLNFNTTSDFMSVEMQVRVTFDSNWQKAEQLLLDILKLESGGFSEQARNQQRRRTALFYTMWEVGEPEIHTDIAASGILFTLKFTVPIGKKRQTLTKISRDILEAFAAAPDVHLAYNTVQVIGNTKK